MRCPEASTVLFLLLWNMGEMLPGRPRVRRFFILKGGLSSGNHCHKDQYFSLPSKAPGHKGRVIYRHLLSIHCMPGTLLEATETQELSVPKFPLSLQITNVMTLF